MVDFDKLRKAKENKKQSNLQQVGITGKVKEVGVNYCDYANCMCKSIKNIQVKYNGKLVYMKNACGFHLQRVKKRANMIFEEGMFKR